MRRERDTQFLSMLTFPSEPHHVQHRRHKLLVWPRRAQKIVYLLLASNVNSIRSLNLHFTNARASRRPQLVSPRRDQKSTWPVEVPNSTNCFFSNPPNPQRFRVLFPIWGFYCDISNCHIRPPRAWTPVLN